LTLRAARGRSGGPPTEEMRAAFASLVDTEWYRQAYPDVRAADIDPLDHYIRIGAAEGRNPNGFFDGVWYRMQYADAAAAGVPPLLHYLQVGAAQLRNPHPRFDAAFYAAEHPEAAANPLLFHLRIGRAKGWITERPVDVADYLPSVLRPFPRPDRIAVSIVIPVHSGFDETRRCLLSVLTDPDRLAREVIVIDDRSPEPALSEWLTQLATMGRIRLVRHARNQGFVAAANRGMREAGRDDVILLNSDTEVPAGWTGRLAAQAYAAPRIASVSPFANRATICSYPASPGGGMAFGLPLRELDDAAQAANAGRGIAIPTTVGFCMYIRRAALDEVGEFNEGLFGRGYGEENDFCLRASRLGWSHRLACDVFVHHEGGVSFGEEAPELMQAQDTLARLYPHYPRLIADHARMDPAAAARFALTVALFRRSGLPCVLMVSHDQGGGVRRHIQNLTERLRGTANVLTLQPSAYGVAVSVPALPGHPALTLAADRLAELADFLRAVPIARAHVHHVMGLDLDLRSLLHRLRLRFDVTLHDWFLLCPQVTMLPRPGADFCGDPGPAACNACIAARPSHGARDILTWRRDHAWLLLEADRVLCPSDDARLRLLRHVPEARAVLVAHEPVPPGRWPMSKPPPPREGEPLRVAVLGVLAASKGADAVIALAGTVDPATLSLHLIGYPEEPLPPRIAARVACTGEYRESDLPDLIAGIRPHVLWFPAQWPETYSYTLSAAIEAGLPIVASRIGAFPERLAGRPLTWLCEPGSKPARWLAAFAQARKALKSRATPRVPVRAPVGDFYGASYTAMAQPARPRSRLVDLRGKARLSVVVIPETFPNGTPTPCAYIRLLQPLDHLAANGDIVFVLADVASALDYRADVIVTQRHAIPDEASVERLSAHCRRQGITLLYDLDDDLLHVPPEHPQHEELRLKASQVAQMVALADVLWVSTEALRVRLADFGREAKMVPNALDERLWLASPAPATDPDRTMRILYMGSTEHDADFALIEPALARLAETSGGRIAFDMIGITVRSSLPAWVNRVQPPPAAMASYPGFVDWITKLSNRWQLAVAPLVDTAFNRCKSSIKVLEYAALGLPVVASNISVFQRALADGDGGLLASNTPDAWHAALAWLARDAGQRRSLAMRGCASLAERHTLSAQADSRRTAWHALRATAHPEAAAAR
jgi:GT2 family glycosyltransferase/glycosyltransferase involved in cell wall biosynthesis